MTSEKRVHPSESIQEALTQLVTAVEAHNREHGIGRSAARIMAGMLQAAAEGQAVDFQTVQRKVAAEAQPDTHSGLTSLKAAHQNTLDSFGITVVHEISSDPERPPSGEVMLKIKNPEIFAARIKSLVGIETRGKVGEPSSTLATVVRYLEKQMRAADYEDPLPEDKPVLENIGNVVSALKEVDPQLNLHKLERYERFQKTGELKHAARVEQRGLWVEQGQGFGPADWVIDTTPERLDEMWGSTIATLHEIERAGAANVATELQTHLLDCVSKAAVRLDTLSWSADVKQKMSEVLIKYTGALIGDAALN